MSVSEKFRSGKNRLQPWRCRESYCFDSSVAILAYYYTDIYGLPRP